MNKLRKYIILQLFISLTFLSCASTSDDALIQQENFINNHPVEKIIFLGDLIHDKFAFQRMTAKSKELFFKILENIDCTLTVGNHDNISFLKDIGLNLIDKVVIDGICFSHYPSINQRFSVFGHYHPKVKLIINSRGIWVACFVLNKERILMPSYGYYTGGLSIKSAQIQKLLGAQYEIFPLAKEKISLGVFSLLCINIASAPAFE